MARINVRITPELHRKLKARAKLLGMSVSELVRQYLENDLTGPANLGEALAEAIAVNATMRPEDFETESRVIALRRRRMEAILKQPFPPPSAKPPSE